MHKSSKRLVFAISVALLPIHTHATKTALAFHQSIDAITTGSKGYFPLFDDLPPMKLWMHLVHLAFWIIMTILITLAFISWKKRKKLNQKMVHFIQAVYDLQKPLELIRGPLDELARDQSMSENQKNKLDVALWSATSIQNTISNLIEQEKADKFFHYILNSTAGRKINLKEMIESKIMSYKQQRTTLDKSDPNALPGKETQSDQIFMEKLMTILKANLENGSFNIDHLSQHIGMSRSSLYHRIKNITGLAPADFIRMYRLEQAKELLATHQYTISEIAFKTGFSDAKYFRTVFKKQYQSPPGTFSKSQQ